jgi:hypothetical protein
MKKFTRITSLALAMVMCFMLCVPAAAAGISPQMRNADYSSTPFIGSSSQYTKLVSRGYGNLNLDKAICTFIGASGAAAIAYAVASVSAPEIAAQVGAAGSGFSYIWSSIGSSLQTEAMQYNPDSSSVGYITQTYEYTGSVLPLEHYYKIVVYYYPYAVYSSATIPYTSAQAVYYEYNWFS